MFTQNCFLRNAHKSLWLILIEFGYQPMYYTDMERKISEGSVLVCSGGTWYFANSNKLPDDCIDCGEDTELFLSIAAMRDDSDSYQWFVCEYEDEEPDEEPGMFLCTSGLVADYVHNYMDGWDVGHCRKAAPEEMIDFYKCKRNKLNNIK